MNEMLCDHIDQLDLALDQLALKDRNFDRFAIMLVDNVVELTLHQYARDKDTFGSRWSRDEREFDPKILQAALGQKFDAKVAFAKHTGFMSETRCRTINWLHSFRNSSHHAGLRHEGILHSLANFYLINCCEILLDYKPPFWSFGSENVSHRAAKYLGDTDSMEMLWKSGEVFDKAWKRLIEVALNMKCNLVRDLAIDLANTVDQADDQIGFISQNAPHQREYKREQVVFDAEVWTMAFSENGVKYAEKNGHMGGIERGPELLRWLKGNYKTSYPVDPIPAWRERVGSLGREKDAHKALDKYCNIMNQTQSVRHALSRQADRLEGHLQNLSDQARGK